jgi:hypothetical protein
MREKEDKEPRPRETFINDIIKKIREWETLKYEIIIGADLNETIILTTSQVNKIINNTTLLPLVETDNAPETYSRGRNCIDYIIGTPKIKRAVTAQGYLPFYHGGWESDHRAMYVDIEIKDIFDYIEPTEIYRGRNLISTNYLLATKFMRNIKETDLQTIEKRLKSIEQNKELTKAQLDVLESADKLFTKVLIEAEKKCKTKKEKHFSEVLQNAKTINKYWRIKCKGQENNIKTANILEQ